MIHRQQLQDISAEKKVFPPQPQAYISEANDPMPVLFCFLDLFVELDLTRVLFCWFYFFNAPKSQRGLFQQSLVDMPALISPFQALLIVWDESARQSLPC